MFGKIYVVIDSSKRKRAIGDIGVEVSRDFPRSTLVLGWSRSIDWIHIPIQFPFYFGFEVSQS